MKAEVIQFRPRPKQSTNLIELGHHLIKSVSHYHQEAIYDSDKILSGEHTAADFYLGPPKDCA